MKKSNPPKQKAKPAELKALEKRLNKLAATIAQQAPAAISGPNPSSRSKPKIRAGKDCIQIDHAEVFVWPIGSSTFSDDRADINPGHSLLFPWLSIPARGFEEFDFRYIRFTYFPRCSTAQAGEIIMAVDPKSGDARPTDLQTIATYHMRVQGAMWKEHVLDVPREYLRSLGRRYITRGAVFSADTRTLYDAGKFHFARDGANPSGAIVGEIAVEYGVNLYQPAQDPEGGINACWVNGAGTFTLTNPFGTTPAFSGPILDDVLGGDVFLKQLDVNFTGNAFYELWIYVTGTGLTGLVITATGLSISNPITVINGGATALMYHARFLANSYAASNFFNATVTGTTVTDALCQVSRANNNITF